MLDLNGIFHEATQKVYEYGKYKPLKRLVKPKKHKMSGNKQKQVYKAICKHIDLIVSTVKPQKRLILCIDGPAPLSKQNQQRQRRFVSAESKTDEELDKFDSNCITPGTKFMDNLSKYIDWHIRKKMRDSSKKGWRSFEVVFSNEKVPGEGEHKCLNYVRMYGDPKDSWCIFGVDSDLVMLVLSSHVNNFFIMRRDLYADNDSYFIIDMDSVRTDLCLMMKWESLKTPKEEEKKDHGKQEKSKVFCERTAVNDFIFMCYTVGNDFLPHIPGIEIIENGIEIMFDVYKTVCESYGHLTYDGGDEIVTFRPDAFKAFIGTLSQYEKGILEQKLRKKNDLFPDPELESCATMKGRQWSLDINKYKNLYYTNVARSVSVKKTLMQENDIIKDICHKYLEGLQWVINYYIKGVPDWKWCFKYHYAPFSSDIAKNIDSFEFEGFPLSSIPTKPFQQLLCVLPPKSASLLPHSIGKLLTDPESPIKHYYPSEFEVDLRGKRAKWEGIVILPMINFNKICEHYNDNIDSVERRDKRRNIVGKSFIYTHVPSQRYTFKSYYGDIDALLLSM